MGRTTVLLTDLLLGVTHTQGGSAVLRVSETVPAFNTDPSSAFKIISWATSTAQTLAEQLSQTTDLKPNI